MTYYNFNQLHAVMKRRKLKEGVKSHKKKVKEREVPSTVILFSSSTKCNAYISYSFGSYARTTPHELIQMHPYFLVV